MSGFVPLTRVNNIVYSFRAQDKAERLTAVLLTLELLAGESPTCVLHDEGTHPVIRAIEVSHAACKADFRSKKHFWSISQLKCIFHFL